MKENNKILKHGQTRISGDQLYGVYKGIVEDTRDPHSLGRIKVRIFGIHGSSITTDVENLPWCEPCFPLPLSISIPPLGSRVWVTFEASDRFSPVWFGFWNAIPVGRKGNLHNERIGSEIPREVWTNSYLEQQAQCIFRSNDGNIQFIEDVILGSNFYSKIHNQDVGGKFIELYSIFSSPYSSEEGQLNENRELRIRKKDLSNTLSTEKSGGVRIFTGDFQISNYNNSDSTSTIIGSSNCGYSNLDNKINKLKCNDNDLSISESGITLFSDIISFNNKILAPPRRW